MNDIAKTVLKFVELIGPSKAAHAMGVSRQTVNNHVKNPGNITVKEYEAAIKSMPALLHPQVNGATERPTAREAMEAELAAAAEEESFGGIVPTATSHLEPVDESEMVPMNFRPVQGAPAPTVMDQIMNRLDRLEEFVRVLAGPYSPLQGNDQAMAAARKLLPELSQTMTGKKFAGADHPLHQVHVQERPRQARRPVQHTAADLSWNTPR